ncbi:TetR family transcriptional regulator [Actinoplanes sp. CA-030573]|uniref:TetR family transcriptional regulator n=1 Tax=Actinoplanes sp. CA-030573 TaxID=3239898 RepID=UPI003D8A340E
MDLTSPPGSGRTALQETLVAAARELAVARGWGNVRMLDVAKAAGVSRQTVYNEFGDRAGLAAALALSEIRQFTDAVRAELFADGRDARAASLATILRVLTEAAADPLIRQILTSAGGGEEDLLPYLTTRSEIVLATVGEVVREWIADRRPEVDDDVAALAAESIIRLTVSHLVLPAASPESSADALAEVFVRLLH